MAQVKRLNWNSLVTVASVQGNYDLAQTAALLATLDDDIPFDVGKMVEMLEHFSRWLWPVSPYFTPRDQSPDDSRPPRPHWLHEYHLQDVDRKRSEEKPPGEVSPEFRNWLNSLEGNQ